MLFFIAVVRVIIFNLEIKKKSFTCLLIIIHYNFEQLVGKRYSKPYRAFYLFIIFFFIFH